MLRFPFRNGLARETGAQAQGLVQSLHVSGEKPRTLKERHAKASVVCMDIVILRLVNASVFLDLVANFAIACALPSQVVILAVEMGYAIL